MRSSLSCVGALLCLSFLGCEKQVTQNDYFPLRDGNRWEYRLLDKPLLGRIAGGQTVSTEEPNADLRADAGRPAPPPGAPVPGRARRVALELRGAVDEITFKALYDTAEQVWSKRNGYIGFQNSRARNYLLILPPHTGYKWVVTGPAGDDLFYEIESIAGRVETPAGSFDECVVSRQENRDRSEVFRYWFAPDVGMVRRSKYFAGEEVFRQELIAFDAKPATQATRLAEDKEVRKSIEGKQRGSEFRSSRQDARATRLDDESVDERIEKYSQPR